MIPNVSTTSGAAVLQVDRAPPLPARFTAARALSEVSNSPHGGTAAASPTAPVQPRPASVGDARAAYDWQGLVQWIGEGREDENRAAAIPFIQGAFQPDRNGIRGLYLSDVPCRTLPPVPPGTTHLDAPSALTVLSVPEGVTHVDARFCTGITEFHFPESLQRLNLSGVPMKSLPSLPEGLRYLIALGCGIETLPATWPPELYVELDLNPVALADPALISTWIIRGEIARPAAPGQVMP